MIYEGEKEAAVRVVLEDENENLLSISRTVDINNSKSLKINGKMANDKDIPCNDFNFMLLDSYSHNQLDAYRLKDFIAKLKEESNKKQIILVSTENDLANYANQVIMVNQKTENQSEIKEMQSI